MEAPLKSVIDSTRPPLYPPPPRAGDGRMRAFALAAFVAAVALSPWGEARAQVAHCTPTQTVSSAPDADGVYTTTLACADTDPDAA